MEIETRSVDFDAAQLRFEQGGDGVPPKLVGYAAVFNSPSKDLGGFVEVLKPGAFRRSLASGVDIRALVDHDATKILGRTSSGTARLVEDDHGLRVEVDPPDTSYARDLMASMKRGDIRGMSFGFKKNPPGVDWYRANGNVTREIRDLDLLEVTFTSMPAYTATEATLRVDPAAVTHAKTVVAERPEYELRAATLRRLDDERKIISVAESR